MALSSRPISGHSLILRRDGAGVGAGFATADAMLVGRVLYNERGAYWLEHADEPFGDVMKSIKKYVLSSSLQRRSGRTRSSSGATWPTT